MAEGTRQHNYRAHDGTLAASINPRNHGGGGTVLWGKIQDEDGAGRLRQLVRGTGKVGCAV